MVQDFTDFS